MKNLKRDRRESLTKLKKIEICRQVMRLKDYFSIIFLEKMLIYKHDFNKNINFAYKWGTNRIKMFYIII